MNKKVDIEVNNKSVKGISYDESERTLEVYMSPSLIWDKQFEIMKEKILEAIYKLKNTLVVVSTACLYYNMYLIKKVCFVCGVMSISL